MLCHSVAQYLITISLTLGMFNAVGLGDDQTVIGFVLDGPWERNQEARRLVEVRIAEEIGHSRVQFPSSKRLAGSWTRSSVAKALTQLLNDPAVDMVITLGVLSSHEAVTRRSLSKPAIATRVVGSHILDVPGKSSSAGRVSGIPNLTYVTLGDLDLGKSMAEFQGLKRFRSVSFLIAEAFRDLAPDLESIIQQELSKGGVRNSQILFVKSSIATTIASLSRDSEAVVLTLLPQLDTDDYSSLLGALHRMQFPVFSVEGRNLVHLGALAGWGSDDALDKIAQRVASNVGQILNGTNAENLLVELNVKPQLAINLETAGTFGISPQDSWQDAMLVMETIGAGASAPSMSGLTPRPSASTRPTSGRQIDPAGLSREQASVLADIRRRIFSLRDFSAFDVINPKVVGEGMVILQGFSFRPTLKSEAERVVATIKGVQQVENWIEVLPASQRDDNLRFEIFGAIYGHATLRSYRPGGKEAEVKITSQSIPRGPHPILILVKNGNVALIGNVSSASHRRTAEEQAKSVPGVISLENYLKLG